VYLFGGYYKLFDVGGAIGFAGMGVMVVFFTLQTPARLYREERKNRPSETRNERNCLPLV